MNADDRNPFRRVQYRAGFKPLPFRHLDQGLSTRFPGVEGTGQVQAVVRFVPEGFVTVAADRARKGHRLVDRPAHADAARNACQEEHPGMAHGRHEHQGRVESMGPEKPHLFQEARRAAMTVIRVVRDHGVETGVSFGHRPGVGMYHHGEVGFRPAMPEGVDHRQRQHHVSDPVGSDHEDPG